MPAAPAAAIVRLSRIRCSSVACRAIRTATVAAISESSMKKCQTLNGAGMSWRVASAGRSVSIEVAELIIQPCPEPGILLFGAGGRGGRRGPVAPRPADRGERDEECTRRAHQVGKRPGEPVESFVDRGRERLLTAVLRDVIRV